MSSIRVPAGDLTTLATADDLDGTTDNSQALDATGAARVIILQIANGTAGTACIDVIEVSHDGGSNWEAATAANLPNGGHLVDNDGDAVASAALNAAGTEPTGAAVFSMGPIAGPCLIRCGRKTTDTSGTTWVTGAPTVAAIRIG
jgi:hypothetical protein